MHLVKYTQGFLNQLKIETDTEREESFDKVHTWFHESSKDRDRHRNVRKYVSQLISFMSLYIKNHAFSCPYVHISCFLRFQGLC